MLTSILSRLTIAPPKASDLPALDSTSAAALVDRYRALRLQLDELEAEAGIVKGQLVDHAEATRTREHAAGRAAGTVEVAAPTGRALVVWPERFRSIPSENEAPLREALGTHYDAVVTASEKATAAPRATWVAAFGEDLVSDMEAAGLLTFERKLTLRKGVTGILAELRAAGDSVADVVSDLLTGLGYAPTVRVK